MTIILQDVVFVFNIIGAAIIFFLIYGFIIWLLGITIYEFCLAHAYFFKRCYKNIFWESPSKKAVVSPFVPTLADCSLSKDVSSDRYSPSNVYYDRLGSLYPDRDLGGGRRSGDAAQRCFVCNGKRPGGLAFSYWISDGGDFGGDYVIARFAVCLHRQHVHQ